MRSQTVEGIILKRENIGEADKIITVYTKTLGKIRVKAKGVRKITSKRSSHVELLNFAKLGIYRHAGMPVLTEIETQESFSKVKESLTAIGFAYHVCELIDKLCPEGECQEEIFTLLYQTLGRLDSASDKVALMNEFGRELLRMLGYGYGERELLNLPVSHLIENIIERKLKSRQILPKLLL